MEVGQLAKRAAVNLRLVSLLTHKSSHCPESPTRNAVKHSLCNSSQALGDKITPGTC